MPKKCKLTKKRELKSEIGGSFFGPAKALKAGVLYVCVDPSGVAAYDAIEDARKGRFGPLSKICRNDLLMSLGEAKAYTNNYFGEYRLEYQKFFCFRTRQVQWVVWEKRNFHQYKGLSEKAKRMINRPEY